MALVQIVPLQAPRTPGERCKVGFISHDNQNIYVLGVGFGGQALPAKCVTLPSTIVRETNAEALIRRLVAGIWILSHHRGSLLPNLDEARARKRWRQAPEHRSASG